MPWDVRLGVPEFSQKGTNLQLVQRAWIQNRFENATPCYFQGDCFRFEHLGGWKVDTSPLKEIPYDERSEWIVGPYARIGADFQCLTTMYPPTKVTLDGNTGEPKLCELCSSLDFKDLFEWGLTDVEIDFGMTDELLARMKVIQELQGNRPIIVRIFDELARRLTPRVFFRSVQMTGSDLSINGVAESNNRISNQLRNFSESEWFERPNVTEINADPTMGPQASQFALTVSQTAPKEED